MAEQAAAGGAGGEDLITIVDVTDPDEPSYADFQTRRRPLTAVQLAALRPMLQKVGAYQFFSRDLGFADAPAVKQFVDSVELEEFKPTKTYRIVQSQFKGTVAGREVVINAELVEKTFALVDDGENISKPRGDDVSGLHAFYIKPHHVEHCQNHRGVNLAHVRGEYSYFENMVHQIQTYCCGVPEDGFMKLTQYRALDMVVRGKPVNWNRYLLQNFQERIRKYKRTPCPLYFAGTLTALIYAALNVDYSMVNKMEQQQIVAATPRPTPTPPPPSPKRTPRSAAGSSKKARGRSSASSTPRKGRKRAKTDTEMETETGGKVDASPRPTRASARRAAAAETPKDGLEQGSTKRLKETVEVSESEVEVQEHMEAEPENVVQQLEAASNGLSRRQVLLLNKRDDIPEVLIGANKTYRLSTLLNQAIGNPITKNPVPLTESKDLWKKYAQYYTLGQECHLEHIISKQFLEESLRKVEELEHELEAKDRALSERLEKVQELEGAVKDKDKKLSALEEKLRSLDDREIDKRSHDQRNADGEEAVEKEEQCKAHADESKQTTSMVAVSGQGTEDMVSGQEEDTGGQGAAAEQEEAKAPEEAVPTDSTMDLVANGAAAQDTVTDANEVRAPEDANNMVKAVEVGTADNSGKAAQVEAALAANHRAKAAEEANAELQLAKRDQLIAALMARLEALEDRT